MSFDKVNLDTLRVNVDIHLNSFVYLLAKNEKE